jgi:hypothetical protein
MTTEWTILDALVTQLNALTGLHAYHAPEPSMSTPAIFPLFDQDFNVSWDGQSGWIEGDLMLVTQWVPGLSRAGAKVLADYAADTGDKSINAAIHGTTLGGVVKSVHVRGVSRGELISFPDGRTYYARPIRVRVYP